MADVRTMHYGRYSAGFLTIQTDAGYFWSHCQSDWTESGGRHGPFATRKEARLDELTKSAKRAAPIVIAYRLDWVSPDAWGVLTMMHGSDHAAGQWLLPQAVECQQSLEYGCGWQVTLRIIYAPS